MISQSEVKAGSATNFSCTLHANPSIEVSDWQWKHNGVTVGFGPVLQLKNTTKKESGIYECSTKNIAGATSAVNNFVVQCEYSFFYNFIYVCKLYCMHVKVKRKSVCS